MVERIGCILQYIKKIGDPGGLTWSVFPPVPQDAEKMAERWQNEVRRCQVEIFSAF